MAYFSNLVNSVTKVISTASNLASSMPFTIDDEPVQQPYNSIWKLKKGKKKDDGSQVSVFVFDCQGDRDKIDLAKNSFKKFRTIRHPNLVNFIDAHENDNNIYIVTEPVVPLRQLINNGGGGSYDEDEEDYSSGSKLDANLISWGLYKVASLLKFLNQDCNLIHGYVRLDNIYCTQAGEWKLGGLEVLSNLKEESPPILSYGRYLPEHHKYSPPEVQMGGFDRLTSLPTTTLDSYQMGILIYEIFNDHYSNTDQLKSIGNIPKELHMVYKRLINPQPKARGMVSELLETSYFKNDLITTLLYLELLNVQEEGDKQKFYEMLSTKVASFPKDLCYHKILPEMVKAFEFGNGGPKALSVIIQIGTKLTSEQYQTLIIPTLLRVISIQDRAIRLNLLKFLDSFEPHLTPKMVSEKVYPNLTAGFQDTVPQLKEATVKGVLSLVGKLSEKLINNDLINHLCQLQFDQIPGIRANTVIGLGKIAKYLNANNQKKKLGPTLIKSLKDPFPHSKMAALMALSSTAEYYEPADCANIILPAIVTVVIDPVRMVREQAFKTIDVYVKKLNEHSKDMPEPIVEPTKGVGSQSTEPTKAEDTWTDWAMTSINKGITSATASIQNRALGVPSNSAPASSLGSAASMSPVSPMKPMSPLKPTTSSITPPAGHTTIPTLPKPSNNLGLGSATKPVSDWSTNSSTIQHKAQQPKVNKINKSLLDDDDDMGGWGDGWDTPTVFDQSNKNKSTTSVDWTNTNTNTSSTTTIDWSSAQNKKDDWSSWDNSSSNQKSTSSMKLAPTKSQPSKDLSWDDFDGWGDNKGSSNNNGFNNDDDFDSWVSPPATTNNKLGLNNKTTANSSRTTTSGRKLNRGLGAKKI